jgi:hypothetical protein
MSFIKGAIVGLISTIILYFIPVVNAFAPLLGGAIGGYTTAEGVGGGFKVGVLMAIFIVIPGFVLAGIIGSLLSGVPYLGEIAFCSGLVITVILVAHTAIFGIIGAMIGGFIAGKKAIN